MRRRGRQARDRNDSREKHRHVCAMQGALSVSSGPREAHGRHEKKTADTTARISIVLKVWHCANSFVAFSRIATSGCLTAFNVAACFVAYKPRILQAIGGKTASRAL